MQHSRPPSRRSPESPTPWSPTRPRFADIASEVAARIAGCVFVAHNARFDYGFLKHEFGRLGQTFTAKVLCTVKLSRRLFADAARHSLDSSDRAPPPAVARPSSRAGRCTHPVGVRADTLSRSSERTKSTPRSADSARAQPAAAPSRRCPRCDPGGPGDLPLLRAQPDAALCRQEHQSARTRCLALFVGLSQRQRSAPFGGDCSHRDRGNRGRARCLVARVTARQVAVPRLQPASAAAHRPRRVGSRAEPSPPDYVRADVIEPRQLHGLYGPFSSRRAARETSARSRGRGRIVLAYAWPRATCRARASRVSSRSAQARASARRRSKLTTSAFDRRSHLTRCGNGPTME